MKQRRRQQSEQVEMARQDRLRQGQNYSPSNRLRSSQSAEYEPEYTIDKSYGELEIGDLVNRYSNNLPLEVVVSKGVYGMEDRYSLATSDRCIIHYIKRRELILIQDPQTNKEFSVPINSALKFGLVYNPRDNEREALNGFVYPLVSDILSETVIPKIGLAHLKDPDVVGLMSVEVIAIKEVSLVALFGATTELASR